MLVKGHDDNHTKVYVDELPQCDLCESEAHFDAKTRQGPWGYLCQECFDKYGVGLGLGKGQKLIVE